MRFKIPAWVGAQQGAASTSPGRQLSEGGEVNFHGGWYFLVLGGEVKKKPMDLPLIISME